MEFEYKFCFCNEIQRSWQEGEELVSVNCGHSFHSVCFAQWINLQKPLVPPGDIRCPRCPEKVSQGVRELGKRLFGKEDVPISDVEIMEIEKNLGAAEIKILLGMTYDQLKRKIALSSPNWRDLTPTFQNELIDTLSQRLSDAPERFPPVLQSKPLIRIITTSGGSSDTELVRLVVDEYIEAVSQRNGGKLSWEKMGESFRDELLQKLRRSSGLAKLELNQVPLTPTTFKLLLKYRDDKSLLAIVTSSYVAEILDGSVDSMESMCSLLLHQWIIEDLHIFGVINPTKAAKLIELQKFEPKIINVIEDEDSEVKDDQFGFVHDSVEHLFLGLIGSRVMELYKISEANNVLIQRKDPFSMYFLIYFHGLVTTVAATQAESIIDTIYKLRNKIIKPELIMACLITKSHNAKDLEMAITQHEQKIYRNLDYKKLEYFIGNRFYNGLTFLHLAALSSNLIAFKLLTRRKEWDMMNFKWDVLMILLLKNTASCSGDVVKMRKEVITELLNHNGSLFNRDYDLSRRPRKSHGGRVFRGFPGSLPLEKPKLRTPLFTKGIHVEFIKFGLQNTVDIYTRDYYKQTVVHKAASYMNRDEFHDLVGWLVKNGHSDVLNFTNDHHKTALEIARCRMKVKPETVKFFEDAKSASSGSSEEDSD